MTDSRTANFNIYLWYEQMELESTKSGRGYQKSLLAATKIETNK